LTAPDGGAEDAEEAGKPVTGTVTHLRFRVAKA
jgi:hypothetical protein